MSVYIDHIKTDNDLPITYSINIKALSTSKRPLTCCITTAPRISKQRTTNQLNHLKPSICVDQTQDYRRKSLQNDHQSSVHLPVTYSTSIHVPCHSPTITPRSPIILPSSSSSTHHHYHHYHYYHQRQSLSSRPSTTIKHKTPQRPVSIGSTRPATTSTTTFTSPESLLQSKKPHKNIHLTLPILPPSRPADKQSSQHHSPLPSYSALVWNWFHHIPPKPSATHKGSQSDYSETCRHDPPSKRSRLFKLITSPMDKRSKSKSSRTCLSRKRLESSSSLPNKYPNYNE
jgi:hypothetical protein